jgi:hypothetical protein
LASCVVTVAVRSAARTDPAEFGTRVRTAVEGAQLSRSSSSELVGLSVTVQEAELIENREFVPVLAE